MHQTGTTKFQRFSAVIRAVRLRRVARPPGHVSPPACKAAQNHQTVTTNFQRSSAVIRAVRRGRAGDPEGHARCHDTCQGVGRHLQGSAASHRQLASDLGCHRCLSPSGQAQDRAAANGRLSSPPPPPPPPPMPLYNVGSVMRPMRSQASSSDSEGARKSLITTHRRIALPSAAWTCGCCCEWSGTMSTRATEVCRPQGAVLRPLLGPRSNSSVQVPLARGTSPETSARGDLVRHVLSLPGPYHLWLGRLSCRARCKVCQLLYKNSGGAAAPARHRMRTPHMQVACTPARSFNSAATASHTALSTSGHPVAGSGKPLRRGLVARPSH